MTREELKDIINHDLDPDKVCDNCMKCMIGDAEWRAIQITGISMGQDQDKPDEDKPAY
jgi:hypothetical protein